MSGATKHWRSETGNTTCRAATAGIREESMPQRRHRGILRFCARSLLLIVPLTAVAAIALGIVALHQQPAAEASVVRHMTSEMPKLDVGVQQAVHATFTGDRHPALGEPAELRLVVTSGASGVAVRTDIKAPVQATLGKGPISWEGKLSELEVAEIPVSVTLPGDRGGFVRAEIIAQLPDGREIRTATAVYVDPGAPDTPAPEAKTLTEPDGRTLDVVVYRPSDR